ncbi:MAG: hypothetical protein HYZ53_20215 [Planctomycetes bacterium]|nr:hypothetical protein [Planctomycetota bacterium]
MRHPIRPRPARLSLLALLLLASLSAIASAQTLTPRSYAEIRKQVDLRPGDLAWQAVDWKSTLFDGLVEAQRQDKPIFVWFYFGDPRGNC